MKQVMRWALLVLLLAACGESSPTEVEEPRDRFDHEGLRSERQDDAFVFVFDEGRYGFFQVTVDTVGFWEMGRYWLVCEHPVECQFTAARTDGRSGQELDYKRQDPAYVGPDGVEIGGGVYEWVEFDEALAMIPESHREVWR